jgi:hypothetical protein
MKNWPVADARSRDVIRSVLATVFMVRNSQFEGKWNVGARREEAAIGPPAI